MTTDEKNDLLLNLEEKYQKEFSTILENERRLRLITDNMSDIVWTMDFDLRYTYISPSVERITGFSPKEIQNLPLKKLLPPEKYKKYENMLAKALALDTGAPLPQADKKLRLEMELLHKTGKKMWVEITLTFGRDNQGKPIEIVGLTRDIGERKQAEATLRESEKRFRAIVENMYESISIMDLNLQFIYQSPSEFRLTGYTPEEILAKPIEQIMRPESYKLVADTLCEILEAERNGTASPDPSKTLELELYHKNGHTIWAEANTTFQRDESGRPIGIITTTRDITSRKLAETALRESEMRYRMIVENMNEVIWTIGMDLQFIYISPSSTRLTGYTPEEARTLPLEKLLTPASYEYAMERLTKEMALEGSGKPFAPNRAIIIDVEAIHKNGHSLWLEITGTFTRNANGEIREILVIGKDITERQRATEEKNLLESQLVQAQKMETVGRLAGGVAHDFNNMLSVILGYVDLSIIHLGKNHPVLKDIAEIEKAANRSRDITAQLLAFSRKQIIAPRIIDLNDQISGTQKTLNRLIGEDIDLNVVFGKNLWPIKFDPSQIEQILMNLAVNARDAMVNGGTLTIETENSLLDAAFCRKRAGAAPGEFIHLLIRDNGCGMDPDTLEHIFEPFFTTKDAGKGTGLGLATVYGIVKQNDGFIEVVSAPGTGTTFHIYLPRSEEALIASDAPEEEDLVHGNETVLLVEDEKLVLRIVTGMLETLGYKVLAARNPLEAMAIFEKLEEPVDLVLTDVVMPKMSGKELRDRLVALKPDTRVLFMSGYTADAIAHHGVLEEGVQFLPKPFNIKALSLKIREVLSA